VQSLMTLPFFSRIAKATKTEPISVSDTLLSRDGVYFVVYDRCWISRVTADNAVHSLSKNGIKSIWIASDSIEAVKIYQLKEEG